MNINVILTWGVILLLCLIAIILARPWELPENRLYRWMRSLIVGLMTSLVVCLGIISIGLENQGGTINIGFFLSIFGNLFLCFGLPMGIIATIGYYFSYRQLGWLQKQRGKITKSR